MQRKIPFGKPILGEDELEGIQNVLKTGILVHGKETSRFEEEFAKRVGVKYAIAVSSCTAGLHLALFSLKIGIGDKVAVPAMSHVATAHVVELQGATPVFIDIDPITGNMDPKKLEQESLKNNFKAIIPVHYLGLPCEMDEINRISSKSNSIVIEDCALALDSEYENIKAGALGLCGAFSFYPVKHMTSIEGGMVTTNDELLAKLIRKKRAFGYNKSLGERSRPGLYDVDELGFNYRMNEIEAAVGLSQIKRLNDHLLIRKRNYNILFNKLNKIRGITLFPSSHIKAKSSFYCFNIVLPIDGSLNRDKLQDQLKLLGIGTSIHYPQAIPLFSYYKDKYNYKKGDFPITEWFSNQLISLPIAAHVTEEDANYIADKAHQLLTSDLITN